MDVSCVTSCTVQLSHMLLFPIVFLFQDYMRFLLKSRIRFTLVVYIQISIHSVPIVRKIKEVFFLLPQITSCHLSSLWTIQFGSDQIPGPPRTWTLEVTSTQEPPILSYNGGSNGFVLLIVGHKLNRKNYLHQSHAVMMFIYGRGKDECLTSALPQPTKEDNFFFYG